jgi:hypothetical protein
MKLNKSRGCVIAAGLGVVGIVVLFVAAGAGLLTINNLIGSPRSSKPGNAASGPVQISGKYEQHSDVTNPGNEGYVHTKIDMVGTFSAKAGTGSTVAGQAQLTFSETYEFAGPGCKISWSTGDVVWSPQLNGTYQKNVDGTIAISMLADPKMSPTYAEDYVCLGKTPAAAPWAGLGGTLVNGVFDARQDFPMTGGATGTNYLTWHMELVPGP